MSTGYLPGAHTSDCPIYEVVVTKRPRGIRSDFELLTRGLFLLKALSLSGMSRDIKWEICLQTSLITVEGKDKVRLNRIPKRTDSLYEPIRLLNLELEQHL